MVRLKASTCRSGGGKLPFQFLMVRLKVTLKKGTKEIKIFQFLMVRLKVLYKAVESIQTYISIPYGSIKSDFRQEENEEYLYFNSLWFD